MKDQLATAAGTVAACLLLSVVALIAVVPCARHDLEHAVSAITNDLEVSLPGLLVGGGRHTAYRRGDARPVEVRNKLCVDPTVCLQRNAASREM